MPTIVGRLPTVSEVNEHSALHPIKGLEKSSLWLTSFPHDQPRVAILQALQGRVYYHDSHGSVLPFTPDPEGCRMVPLDSQGMPLESEKRDVFPIIRERVPTIKEVTDHLPFSGKCGESGESLWMASYLGKDGMTPVHCEIILLKVRGKNITALGTRKAKGLWVVLEDDLTRSLFPIRWTGIPMGLREDDPMFDCTDGAHPAWWRGHDYTARAIGDSLKEAREEARVLTEQNKQLEAIADAARALVAHGEQTIWGDSPHYLDEQERCERALKEALARRTPPATDSISRRVQNVLNGHLISEHLAMVDRLGSDGVNVEREGLTLERARSLVYEAAIYLETRAREEVVFNISQVLLTHRWNLEFKTLRKLAIELIPTGQKMWDEAKELVTRLRQKNSGQWVLKPGTEPIHPWDVLGRCPTSEEARVHAMNHPVSTFPESPKHAFGWWKVTNEQGVDTVFAIAPGSGDIPRILSRDFMGQVQRSNPSWVKAAQPLESDGETPVSEDSDS